MDEAVGDTVLCVDLPAMLFGAECCGLTEFSSCQSVDLKSSERRYNFLFSGGLSS